MFQTVDGHEVFVVDFDTMPELPIRWSTLEEQPYALALAAALTTGVITEPGKYAIEVTNASDPSNFNYNIYTLTE